MQQRDEADVVEVGQWVIIAKTETGVRVDARDIERDGTVYQYPGCGITGSMCTMMWRAQEREEKQRMVN